MRAGSLICGVVLGAALLDVQAALAAPVSVAGRVTDENNVAVAGTRIEAFASPSAVPITSISDKDGSFTLELPAPGGYRIRAEHLGFFVYSGESIAFQEGSNQLIITLNHLQEFAESVEVAYSPPVIDPKEPNEQKQLTNVEILDVPYPASQDFRSALPMIQGVVQDAGGRLHFNGGASDQTNFTMNGFNLTDPFTGRLEARLNIETVQSLDLESGRYSAEKGRGSAGSLDIKTRMGDDRWRFSGTNFIPGVSGQGGLFVNKWTPRVQVSGPLAKGRAWFHNGFDSFFDVNLIDGLPRGQDRSRSLTTSNLTRFQVNLTPANILTGSFLFNYGDDNRHGLSFLDPIETTTDQRQNLYMTTLRDQIYFRGGALLDFGFADSRGLSRQSPQGTQTFEILPSGRRGNYFENLTRHIYRQQWLANAFLPTVHWAGSHQFKVGADFERASFTRAVDRHDYEVLRENMSVARRVSFAGNRLQSKKNFEVSQYVQDRWVPRDGVMVEAGLRADWDQVVRDVLWSPRLSVAYAPKWLRDTKVAAGYGVFHDALTLSTLTQHQDQISLSTFFLRDGQVLGPVQTAFLVNEHALRAPRYRTLSFTIERKLPFGFFGKASYSHRVGSRGFTFINELEALGGTAFQGAVYQLRNWRHDRYDAAEFTIRRTFAGQFEWLAGYTRSSARSDAVIDYSLENPIFAPQGPGPLSWDTPNRFLTWGWAPIPKRAVPHSLRFLIGETNVAYLIEYRTGFPFSTVNEEGFLEGDPNGRRFPSYFSINLHFERRFRFLHYLWAGRIGFNNITNNGNPNIVNNNVDSPYFLAYGRGQVRAFAVRLRFLGKK